VSLPRLTTVEITLAFGMLCMVGWAVLAHVLDLRSRLHMQLMNNRALITENRRLRRCLPFEQLPNGGRFRAQGYFQTHSHKEDTDV
jgi:hypothetical protein